jgi:hypothetical protein
MVQDWSTSRVAVFSSHGALARTFALGPPPQRPRATLVGAFTDQTLLGAGSDYLTNTNPPPGIFTLTQTLFTFSPAGTALRPLKTMLERQFVLVAMPGNEAAARYVRPFGAIGTIRVAGDNYLVGDGSTFEIFEYSQGGRLHRVLRVSLPRRRITEADKAAEKRRILAFYGTKTTNPAFERFWSAVPWRDRLPAFRRFEIDPDHRLWVEVFGAAGDSLPVWFLFDEERRFLGSVTLPKRFDIRQITRDGILGVRRDADDVEQVVYYSFAK